MLDNIKKMAKKDNTIWWVIGVIAILVLVVGGGIGIFNGLGKSCSEGEFICKEGNAWNCVDKEWDVTICRGDQSCQNCPSNEPGVPCPVPTAVYCVSPYYGGVTQEYCGDGTCQSSRGEDKYECPIDCGLPLPVCGDGICNVFHYPPNLPPYSNDVIDEFDVCPQDCGGGSGTTPSQMNNEELIYSLNQKQRPLVGGLSIQMPRQGGNFALCSIGAIVNQGSSKYVLTAGHCVTDGDDGFPDTDDIGLVIKQGDERIGTVYKTDFTGGVDGALIKIDGGVSSKLEDFTGNSIYGWGSNSDAYIGQKVFKIGRTTGLTYGTISEFVGYTGSDGKRWKGYEVEGDNGKFSEAGDSGSAIITVSTPHKIIGIISAGDGSNMPDDLKSKLGF